MAGESDEPPDQSVSGGIERLTDPEKLAALRSFIGFVASLDHAQTLERILQRMLGAASRAANFDSAAALTVDRAKRLVVRAVKGKGLRSLVGKRYEGPSAALLLPFYDTSDTSEPFIRALKPAIEDFDSAYLLPLVRMGKLLAVLLFGRRGEGGHITQSETDFLRLFANVAAAAIESGVSRTDLKLANQRLTRRTYQLHTLFEVAREIAKAGDERALYRTLLALLCGQLNIAGAGVLMKEGEHFVLEQTRGIERDANSLQAAVSRLLEEMSRTASGEEPSVNVTNPMATSADSVGFDYLVPLIQRGETAGLIGIAVSAKADLTEDELGMIAALGRSALVVRENLRLRDEMVDKERMERELAIARRIQQTLLPTATPALESYEVAGRSIPSREVGGDYFDFFEIGDGRVGLVIGDVTGKGVPAALLMASVQATLRALAVNTAFNPSELVARVNASVHRAGRGENYVTLFYGILDQANHLFFSVNGGHCYPLLVRVRGEIVELGEGGLLLGLTEGAAYREEQHRLEAGDVIFLFTDGLTDSESASQDGEFFGGQRLRDLLLSLRHLSAGEILRTVLDAREAFSGPAMEHDDTTIVVVKRLALKCELTL